MIVGLFLFLAYLIIRSSRESNFRTSKRRLKGMLQEMYGKPLDCNNGLIFPARKSAGKRDHLTFRVAKKYYVFTLEKLDMFFYSQSFLRDLFDDNIRSLEFEQLKTKIISLIVKTKHNMRMESIFENFDRYREERYLEMIDGALMTMSSLHVGHRYLGLLYNQKRMLMNMNNRIEASISISKKERLREAEKMKKGLIIQFLEMKEKEKKNTSINDVQSTLAIVSDHINNI